MTSGYKLSFGRDICRRLFNAGWCTRQVNALLFTLWLMIKSDSISGA